MAALRSALSALFFICFGLGGLLLGTILVPVLLLFGGKAKTRALRTAVRTCYRLFVGAARATGLFRVVVAPEVRERLTSLRGCVVAANHPTLIDVIILLAILPDSTAIAKSAAGRNFFYSFVVKGAFIVNDDPEKLLQTAEKLLAEGVNVVIFPEGTRTPQNARQRKLHRGAAQIALHAGVPVRCVRIACDPPVLAKGQPWWDVADRTIEFSLDDCGEIPAERKEARPSRSRPSRAAAISMTERIHGMLFPSSVQSIGK